MMEFVTTWLASVPGYMTPLLLASVGLIICERAGVLNLGSEGLMAIGAMAGAVAILSGAPVWVGFIAGAAGGLLAAIPFALAVVVFRANQIMTGLALVAIGLGTSAVIGRDFVHRPFAGLTDLTLGPLANLPLIGPALFEQDVLTYGVIAFAVAATLVLRRTRLGLRIRAVGEDPATADAAGIDVQAHQIGAVLVGCLLIGLAGAYLSVAGSRIWVDGMVAGRGWVALALVVFAQWSPTRAILGALIFGGAEALIPRLQAIGFEVPIYLLAMMPYVLTIGILVLVAALGMVRTGEPGHLGRPYIRQDR